jgi:hypothetical protein
MKRRTKSQALLELLYNLSIPIKGNCLKTPCNLTISRTYIGVKSLAESVVRIGIKLSNLAKSVHKHPNCILTPLRTMLSQQQNPWHCHPMTILEPPRITAALWTSYAQPILADKRHKMTHTLPQQLSFFSTSLFLGPDTYLSLQDERYMGYDVPPSKCPPSPKTFVAHKDGHETKWPGSHL